jgi:hypothetical protein
MFVSVVGDIDADGVADIYASDWSHEAKGPTTGRIFVHSGADGRRLLTLTGEAQGDGFGIGPADAGDVDVDGHADLVIGAWRHAGAAPAGGKVYLYSRKDGSCRAPDRQGDGERSALRPAWATDGDGGTTLVTSGWSAVNGPAPPHVHPLGNDAAQPRCDPERPAIAPPAARRRAPPCNACSIAAGHRAGNMRPYRPGCALLNGVEPSASAQAASAAITRDGAGGGHGVEPSGGWN